MITGDKEKHSAANLQYLIHTSHPLAAVGVQPLRQPCVQHPVITFAQGVDERSGVRTTVEHLATLGVQRIDFQTEHFLENADNIHNFQIPSAVPIAPAAISAATSSIRSLSVPFHVSVTELLLPLPRTASAWNPADTVP